MSNSAEELTEKRPGRLMCLDGWRAISILLVLATHMLPLGPKWMQLNVTAGHAGMSLFFTLSGFLIVQSLNRFPSVLSFYVRRVFRIVPLAFVYGTFVLLVQEASLDKFYPVWLFYLNYSIYLSDIEYVVHFWSLCVEMHFYLAVGLLIAICGKRGLFTLPIFALAFTALRIAEGVHVSILTHYRIDEVLAGAVLALVYQSKIPGANRSHDKWYLSSVFLVFVILFLGSCHPLSGDLQYMRPYLGASVVGITLYSTAWYSTVLESSVLRYIAEISFALYVIHPVTMIGWLGAGEGLEKYLKRPVSFIMTFLFAHISSFYFEKPLTNFGRWLSSLTELRSPHLSKGLKS